MSARKKGTQKKPKAEPPPVAKKARIYDFFAPKADTENKESGTSGDDYKPASAASASAAAVVASSM
jgi:hypothetical protein